MSPVPRLGGLGVVGLAAVLGAASYAGPAVAQNAVSDAGLYVTVPTPLTGEAFARVKNRVDAARAKADRRSATVVFDFNPGDKDAATADFASCYNLGRYIADLRDVATVAYVHQKVTRQTVFPVLACQQLVVGPDGAVGEVVRAGDPALNNFEAQGYTEVALQGRPAFAAVARKMFDPGVQLRKGKKGGAEWYVDLRDRVALEKQGVQISDTAPLPAAPDGRVGLFTANQLRDLNLSQKTVESRQDLLDAFGLTAAALRDDPLAGRAPVGFRYVVRGAVDGGVREAVGRVVKDVVRQKGNILILQLECAGGDFQAARELAEDLTKAEAGEDGLLVVAFVPDRAPDTAAVIALGCSEIVMSRRKDARPAADDPAAEAEIGDFEAALGKGNAANAEFWAASLRPLAEGQGYPPLLVDGMLKRDVEVLRVRKKENRSVRRLMSAAEWQEDAAKGAKAEWVKEAQVKPKGQLLKMSATQAEELGLARFTVDTRDVAEVYARYGLEPGKVREAAPAWLDRFATFLKIPAVTVLLVVIGFTGLILELKVPGTAVPGIIAALCFILVFWAHTQFSGQVAVLAGLLFVLGLVLVMLEVFVLPGFGAAGIFGILLMIGALGLVVVGEIPQTTEEWGTLGGKMAQYLFGMMGSVALAFLVARYLPHVPYANRLMLIPPGDKPGADAEASALPGAAQAAGLLGAVGTAVTVLRPAGTVRFGEAFVDVVTEGGYVPAGARVQVVEVEGTRIVVKEV